MIKSASKLILVVEVHCHKVQGMTEAFTDTPYNRAKTVRQIFSSETADKFARDYVIER